MLTEYLAVALGGAAGSVSRFGVSTWIQTISRHKDFPWGTFVVNVSGCFVMGLVAAFLIHRFTIGPAWRAAIVIGFLGGFTTFSSFTIDTISLLQQGDYSYGLLNIFLTLIACLVATLGGVVITYLVLHFV